MAQTQAEKNVATAQSALKDSLKAARDAGYRVRFQQDVDGDQVAILDGGPEPKAEPVPQPAPQVSSVSTKAKDA